MGPSHGGCRRPWRCPSPTASSGRGCPQHENDRSPPLAAGGRRLAAIGYGWETAVTVQPEHPHAPETEPRVPRTINGIADALTGARHMEFSRAVGEAEAGPDLRHVIATWWGQAMLDTDPDRDRIIAAFQENALLTVTMAEVIRRRRASGGAMPGQ